MRKDYRNSRSRSKQAPPSGGTPPWFWMLTGFAPGILIATLIYLDKTDPSTHQTKKKADTVKTVKATRTSTRTPDTRTHKFHQNTNNDSNRSNNQNRIRTASKTTRKSDEIKFTFYQKLQKGETRISDRELRRAERRRQLHAEKERREKRKQARLKRIAKRKKRLAERRKKRQLAAKKRAAAKKRIARKNAAKKKAAKKKVAKKKTQKRKTLAKNKRSKKPGKKPSKKKVAKKSSKFPNNILIQAGSFKEKPQAQRRKAKLAGYGVNAAISPATIKGEKWYRVRVGPFRSYKEMKSKIARLRKKKIGVISIRIPSK